MPITSGSSCTTIPVLEFLKGKEYSNEIWCYISALRPSKIEVIDFGKTVKSTGFNWRVRVYLDKDNNISEIQQEVIIKLTKDVGSIKQLKDMICG